MKCLDELDNNEWGGGVLHEHLGALGFGLDKLKDIVFRDAVRLLCNLCGVTLDIAVNLLQRTLSTDVPDGIYTAERYHSRSRSLNRLALPERAGTWCERYAAQQRNNVNRPDKGDTTDRDGTAIRLRPMG
ncbi:hypothetical protein [Burkholderia vietnamiensis]|uniref:hypothetical protein n=1 Tax=Burkholderia vietnamiensis TaxID=60552 RepID=UPI00158C2821|nr:hypothetical protein [Burkholderia vietnamiensis]